MFFKAFSPVSFLLKKNSNFIGPTLPTLLQWQVMRQATDIAISPQLLRSKDFIHFIRCHPIPREVMRH